jgi:hypothetical protein
MKYQEQNLIDVLLVLVDNELEYEKEYNEYENQEYTEDLVNAKLWLLKKKKLPKIVIDSLFEDDVKKYLNK